jgi:hypothetical protein
LLSTKDRKSIAQIALMKRFVLIAILIPLANVTAVTVPSLFDLPAFRKQLQEEITRYTICIAISGDSGCSFKFTPLMSGYAFSQTFLLIARALITTLLLVYTLAPIPARQFWESKLKQGRQLFCGGRVRKKLYGKKKGQLRPSPV